jgi:hypothetical protein
MNSPFGIDVLFRNKTAKFAGLGAALRRCESLPKSRYVASSRLASQHAFCTAHRKFYEEVCYGTAHQSALPGQGRS